MPQVRILPGAPLDQRKHFARASACDYRAIRTYSSRGPSNSPHQLLPRRQLSSDDLSPARGFKLKPHEEQDDLVLSLQRKAFPPLGSFLRLGGRGVGLLRDMRMHAIVSDLPDHQNPRPVLVSA